LLIFYYTFVENKGKMKVLKLLLVNPHYLVILMVIGVLFIVGGIFEILSYPFLLVVRSTGKLIKLLLKLLR
tara:strand:- start:420 stop:632 length:213 start_codon:yes stop_codon:yes gene_type:complete